MSPFPERTAIFIAGNSRSGTTMLSRILGNNRNIYTFQEIHFFDELINIRAVNKSITSQYAALLYANLISISRKGYFGKHNPDEYLKEANGYINVIKPLTAIQVYKHFLYNEAEKNQKLNPCEHTPQNIFYLNELFNAFENVKVIIMVRDPRAVLLSQKNKWKRRNLSGGAIPFWESVRSRINYHPVTISKIWKSVMLEAEKYEQLNSVKFIKYEALISDTESTLKSICSFLNIDFDANMLDIPVVGSSNFRDEGIRKGVDTSKKEEWKNGGLNKTEIHICQQMNLLLMKKYNYLAANVDPVKLSLLGYRLILPFQLMLALMFNLKRLKNPVALFKKMFHK